MLSNDEYIEYLHSSDALFHYTKLTTALENILEDSKLRLSSLQNTNDPQEYKFLLLGAKSIGQQPSDIGEMINKENTEIDRVLRYRSRILCFCINEKKDSKYEIHGYSKSRMWSQYAENHKGVCLVLSKSQLYEDLTEYINKSECFFSPVLYRYDQRIKWNAQTIDVNMMNEFGLEEYAYYHARIHCNDLFFSKNNDYKDECEYRILFIRKEPVDYIDISKALRGIIIGDKTPDVYLPIIKLFSEKYSVNKRRLYWANGEPHLIYCEKE